MSQDQENSYSNSCASSISTSTNPSLEPIQHKHQQNQSQRKKRSSLCLETTAPLFINNNISNANVDDNNVVNFELNNINNERDVQVQSQRKVRRSSVTLGEDTFHFDNVNIASSHSQLNHNHIDIGHHNHNNSTSRSSIGNRRGSLTLPPKSPWPENNNLHSQHSHQQSSFNHNHQMFLPPQPQFETFEASSSLFPLVQQNQQQQQQQQSFYLDAFPMQSQNTQNDNMQLVMPREAFRKGSWTKDEDILLTKFATEQGDSKNKNWTDIAAKIKGRSAKQCRERWCFNLDPTINKEDWAMEEDLVLIRQQKECGNKWALIANSLPGRTENAVKTRYKSILRAKNREWKPEEDLMLLQLNQSIGPNWEVIAQRMATKRTKHAVKMRFKDLSLGLHTVKKPELGSARYTVREMMYPSSTLKQISDKYIQLAEGIVKAEAVHQLNEPQPALKLPSMATSSSSNTNDNNLAIMQQQQQQQQRLSHVSDRSRLFDDDLGNLTALLTEEEVWA